MLVTVAFHLFLPALLIVWTALTRTQSRVHWLSIAAVTATYLLFLHVAGAAWSWFSPYFRQVFWLLLLLAIGHFLWHRWQHIGWWPARRLGPWINLALLLICGLWFASPLPALTSRRAFTGAPIDLRFPLRDGRFHIAHGGANETVNHHYPVPAQRYALDIAQLDNFGLRARGLLPEALDHYAIYGAAVHAPCSGPVLDARADRPEQRPPEMDPDHPAGNYVTLACHGATVLLAHLQHDSVHVARGDRVAEGQVLGKVGNSGNTSEPHLHIHAVRGEQTDERLWLGTGQGVPLRFAGRFLARNDHVDAP